MKRALLLPFVALLGVAGCGSGHASSAPPPPATGTLPPQTAPPATTAAPAPSVATTTTTVDVSRVPPRITVAYVDAVLRVLDHIEGNGVRAAVTAHNLTPKTMRDFRSVFAPTLRSSQYLSLLQAIHDDYAGFRQPPGDVVIVARRVIAASPTCVFARVHTDYAAESRLKTARVVAEYLELRKRPTATPRGLNPTRWLIAFDRVTVTRTPIPDQCPAR